MTANHLQFCPGLLTILRYTLYKYGRRPHPSSTHSVMSADRDPGKITEEEGDHWLPVMKILLSRSTSTGPISMHEYSRKSEARLSVLVQIKKISRQTAEVYVFMSKKVTLVYKINILFCLLNNYIGILTLLLYLIIHIYSTTPPERCRVILVQKNSANVNVHIK